MGRPMVITTSRLGLRPRQVLQEKGWALFVFGVDYCSEWASAWPLHVSTSAVSGITVHCMLNGLVHKVQLILGEDPGRCTGRLHRSGYI